MSAYDKLGLAMIPSGYKGEGDENNAGGFLGKVYSVLPAQTTSDNLVTNGDFSDGNTGWSEGTGWTIANGVATSTGTAGFTYLSQGNVNTGHKEGKGILTLTISGCTNFSQAGIVVEATLGGSGIARNFNTLRDSGVVLENGVITFTQFSNYRPNLSFWNNTGSPITIDNISYQVITDGDFDFSRGSDATRVNSQGYIESVQVLSDELVQNGDFEEIGSELVTNGGFDTNSDWSLPSGVTYNALGYLDCDGTTTSNINQSTSIAVNKLYKVVFEIKNYVSGNLVRIRISGGTYFDTTITGDGTYTVFFKADQSATFRIYPTNLVGSIDNISVKEVGQNWKFGTGWTISDGKANATSAAFSRLETPSGVDAILTIGKIYKCTFDVVDADGGEIYVERNINDVVLTGVDSVGSYTVYFTATDDQVRFQSRNTSSISIDNISVKEVTDDTDIPRLDYTNQACPSLLLEPERTNYILQSQKLSQIQIVSSQYSITDNQTVSPTGEQNASLIQSNSTGGQYIGRSFTLANDRVISAFVKYNNSATRFYLGFFTTTNDVANAVFDIQNGTVLSKTTGSSNNKILESAKIEDYGNGWYRCSAHISGTSGVSAFGISDVDAVNYIPDIQTTGLNLFAFGFQVEAGSYATSYIPTNGSTVTRLADVCNNAGDSTIFNDAEGVLFVEINKPTLNPDDYWLISVNDNSASNTVAIGWTNGGDELFARVIANGVVPVSYISGEYLAGEYYKIALKYKSGDSSVWVNGEKVHPDLDTFSFTNSLSSINFDYGNGNNDFRGGVRQLLYFNEALTDAELEALTSSNIDRVLKNYNRRGELLGATYESTHVKTKLNELF